VTASMSARKASHGTIFLIVSSGSPLALIASSRRSTSKKPFCPMTRSLHPPATAGGQRVRFATTWPYEFFEVPASLNRVHYQCGKFALANLLAAAIVKDKSLLSTKFLSRYLMFSKDRLIVPLMTGAANMSISIDRLATVPIEF